MSLLDSELFRRTLGGGAKKGKEEGAQIRLRESLLRFRDRAGMLAEEIHRSMPSLTVHGGTHLDALWEMADLIAGPDYLNPVEGFALGGACLLHDLGLGLAAWPEGIEGLKEDPGWKDTVAGHLRPGLGRAPTPDEIAHPSAEIQQAALEEWLRLRHASQAERLAIASWRDPKSGATYHLLEDADLREALGAALGRIAHSHWWPVSRLAMEFGTPLGALASPEVPHQWTLDLLKVAVLLRVADAAHLDARRAPGFLWAMRHPEGISWEHWAFQNHLLKPRVEEDRLVFTAARPFPRAEAEAWWLCQDTLRMVDGELRQCDALLADTARPRLRARSVAGIEDARRLKEYIPVSGWAPVDARIHVSSVADLVERLGGEQLYGDDPTVPLRELIQNAADAVRARRVLEDRPVDWGRITVRLGRDVEGSWIEVDDTGIGMSEAVLSGPLLDFGTTYWGSNLMREEHPGLWAKRFEPTGRFGIGFFSIFMWGSQIQITSRRYDEGLRETWILEFRTGLHARPLVRPAQPKEQLRDPGTRVRVWLKEKHANKGGLLHIVRQMSLLQLCAWIAPALDVDVYAEEDSTGRIAVQANDWKTLDAYRLLTRIAGNERPWSDFESVASRMRLIEEESGRVVGRASIGGLNEFESLTTKTSSASVVTVGGLRARSSKVRGKLAGLLLGSAEKVSRDVAVASASTTALSRWATEQARLIAEASTDPNYQIACAVHVRAYGGITGPLAIAQRQLEFVSFEQIATWLDVPDEVIVVEMRWEHSSALEGKKFSYNSNVLSLRAPEGELPGGYHRILQSLLIEALAQAWGSQAEAVYETSFYSGSLEVGTRDGAFVLAPGRIIRNPRVLPK